ncbi:SDR family oxidoreductase [Pseudomonas shirazica]|uniref:SDR family NAD(P)-dependent oxidoreductase n=1 Tax=Pseudomonas asiatica TaxID=2219225 RepID=UPI00209B21E6|nr:SDR family oxidoreductase [Pseudomonas asiatica]MCO7535987.1 SDR family oxidoreductase [Pseudomonas asiatica]MCO7549585.1 SDR family oxidoreductase [Pseudomonas asiatica]MCO7559711.1 SDR family oxidoreductase [Pseudomonas asiatica]UQB77131.1 SDR family oxidoreductase [Pseudomonas shirazica]
MKLKGKKILVTGGSNGIGRALVQGFLEEGASVFFSYFSDAISADVICREAALGGDGRAHAMACNIADQSQAKQLVEQAITTLGHIDVLVNNAGVFARQAFLEITEHELQRVISVNLINAMLISQQVARHMVSCETPGSLIHISSLSAQRARSRMVHYQASKAALNAMSEGIALELGEYGIRSNVISPGLTETQANRDQWGDSPDLWRVRAADIPLGRAGLPHDYLGAAVLLASDDSQWISGANIRVDGGMATF